MTTTDQLMALGRRYAEHRKLSLTTLGTYAVNDGKFFTRLGSGSGCTLRTAEKVVRWFRREWPEDLEWPSDIPRPAAPKAQKKEAAR